MRIDEASRTTASWFRRALLLTSLLELPLAVAAVKTFGHPAITAFYIVSGLAVALMLLHARKQNTRESYSQLSTIGFAVFIVDTVICLLWTP